MLVLRHHDVQQLFTDPRTRQAETEFPRLRGIHDGTLFDFFQYSMLIPRLQLTGEPPEVHGHVAVRRVGGMRVHWSTAM